MLKAINIKWDTDEDKEGFNELPTEMIIPNELEELYKKDKEYALEEISDWLSDETGFCHEGFEVIKKITKDSVENEIFDFLINKIEIGDVPEIEDVYIAHSSTGYGGVFVDCANGQQIQLIIQVD